MNKLNIKAIWLLLALIAPITALADRFYVEPADLEVGKTATLVFILENSQDYYGFQAEVKLPEGLEALKGSDGELEIALSGRADAGEFSVNSNVLADGKVIMSAFSSNHKPFTGDNGVLVNMSISVAEDFTGGSVEVSNVMFTDSMNKDVEFDSSSATFGVKATGISLSETELSLMVGQTALLAATITPNSATDKTVTWSSSDAAVATVDAAGSVTAVSLGTAIITVTCGSVSATCAVTVVSTPAEGITLSQTSAELKVGESVSLTATVYPEDATDKTVSWRSSAPDIVSVDATGLVTAISVGDADITATCGNISAVCEVAVLPILVEVITLTTEEWSGAEGDCLQLEGIVLPENATDKSLTWTSSNENIAIVNNSGLVRIKGEGECVVIAKANDGSGIEAQCHITGLSGIESIFADSNVKVDVYNLGGVLVKKDCDINGLRQMIPGVYILQYEHKVVKIIVK